MPETTDAVDVAPTIRVAPSTRQMAAQPDAEATIVRPPLARGDRIGRYEVEARVGQGGMGEVYRALDPGLGRQVAIKIVHGRADADLDTQRALVVEAQALARLSHPNVVQVYDAGADAGRVFIAMELVEGKTLQRWLGEGTRPDWRQIVDVYIAAGRGLVAAHDAGIVHGDFKPTNVMIGAEGRPRVFDFGLATSVDPELARTERGGDSSGSEVMVRGTPAFMAPEQMRGDALTPATDQFAFCVALHHALWQAAPFGGDTMAALQRNVTTGALQLPAASDVPAALRRIVARGLAADPERRYPSMAALLAALGRVRLRRRNLVLGTAAAFVGAGVIAWAAWPDAAKRCGSGSDRSAAIWSTERQAEVAKVLGQSGKAYADETAKRLKSRLDDYVASWNRSHEAACEAASEGNEGGLDAAMACLGDALSELDATLGLFAAADDPLVNRALAVVDKLPDPQQCVGAAAATAADVGVDATELRGQIAAGRASTRAGRYKDAEKMLAAVLADPRLPSYPRLHADATIVYAEANEFDGNRAVSLPMYREGIALAAAAKYSLVEARGWIHLVRVAGNAAEFDEANGALKQAELLVARLREDGSLAPDVLVDLDSELGLNAGTMEVARGDLDAAAKRFEDALANGFHGVGSREREAAVLNNLGVVYGMRGDHEKARGYFARAAVAKRELFGPDHPDVATCMLNEGVSLHQLGEAARARERLLEVIEIRQAAFGPEHAEVGSAYTVLATIESALGNLEEALSLYQRALAIRERTLGVDHQSTAITRNNLGDTLLRLGRPAEARPYVEDSLAHMQRRLGPEHPLVAYPLHTLGEIRLALGEYAAAVSVLEQVVAMREKQTSVDPHDLALSRFALAKSLVAAGGDAVRARTLAEQAREVLRGPGRHPDVLKEIDAWLAAQGEGTKLR